MILDEIIAEIKAENPTLRKGSEEAGYEQLTAEEYEATIAEWASNRFAKLQKIQAEAEAIAKRQALLNKLGITEEEAKLLLGGN